MARKKNDTAEDVAAEKVDVVSAKEQVETSESTTQDSNESETTSSHDEGEAKELPQAFALPAYPDVDLMDIIGKRHKPSRSTLFQDELSEGVTNDWSAKIHVVNTTTLRIKRLDHAGAQPDIKYQSASAAGLDLYAAISDEMKIKPGGRVQVPTGLAVEIPYGFEGQVRPRSSLAWKDGIMVVNSPGTVDADYRGEIKVLLLNTSNNTFRVQPGDRIAQMVIAPVVQVSIEYVDELSTTVRGTGGFGSTGK